MSEETKMTNPPVKQTKMIKIKATQPIRLDRESNGKLSSVDVQPGTVVEVTEEEAQEFCDRKFKGYHAFDGERSEKDAPRSEITRAVRVA
jgi:hypothetical protein